MALANVRQHTNSLSSTSMTGNVCTYNNPKAPGAHRAGLLGHLRLRLRHHLRNGLLRVLLLGLPRSRLVLLRCPLTCTTFLHFMKLCFLGKTSRVSQPPIMGNRYIIQSHLMHMPCIVIHSITQCNKRR